MSSKLKSEDGKKKKTKTENKEAQAPDLDKLKGELRKELKQEFQKKINLLTAESKLDLKE